VVRKRYGLFVLAILLLLAGAVGFYLGSHNPWIRILGLLAVTASVRLVQMSRVHDGSGLGEASGLEDLDTAKGPGRLLWIVSLASVPVLGTSCFLLYLDALHGYHETWPVWVFTGVALACIGIWTRLVTTLTDRWRT
jgi:hypothetical protein